MGTYEVISASNRTNLTVVNSGALTMQVDYTYDAMNRMVRRTYDADGAGSGTATDQFWAYDESINAMFEFNGSTGSDLKHRYLWSDQVDELLVDSQLTNLTTAGNAIWGLADHLGTIRDLADYVAATDSTSVTNHRVYNAYGKLVSETNSAVDLLFGFTGKQSDDATGLQHNLFRWYDPALGRWISQDPIGFNAGDANLNRYVGNGATNATDPSGLEWTDIFVAGLENLKTYPGNVASTMKGYFWNGPKNVVVGTASSIYNYDQTYAGIVAAASDPQAAIEVIAKDYQGKLNSYEGQGEVGFDVVTALLAVGKLGKAKLLKKLGKVADAPSTGPFGPRSIGAAERASVNPYKLLADDKVVKSRKTFERKIAEHEKTLADYIKDPDSQDHLGRLPAVSPEIRTKRIQGRVNELNSQLEKQYSELQKIYNVCDERGL